MAGTPCAKAAACAGGCLEAILDNNFRELTEVAVKLSVTAELTNNLNSEQIEDIIELYTGYEDVVKRHKKADREARERLKEILDLS